MSLPTELEFDEGNLDSELAWALESDEEGSFEAGVDWTSDEDEEPYYREKLSNEEVDHDAEPSLMLTAQEIGNLGRRFVAIRLIKSWE